MKKLLNKQAKSIKQEQTTTNRDNGRIGEEIYDIEGENDCKSMSQGQSTALLNMVVSTQCELRIEYFLGVVYQYKEGWGACRDQMHRLAVIFLSINATICEDRPLQSLVPRSTNLAVFYCTPQRTSMLHVELIMGNLCQYRIFRRSKSFVAGTTVITVGVEESYT